MSEYAEFLRCLFCCQYEHEEYGEEGLGDILITNIISGFRNAARIFHGYHQRVPPPPDDQQLPNPSPFINHRASSVIQSNVQNTARIHDQGSNFSSSRFPAQVHQQSNLGSSNFTAQVHQESKPASSKFSTQIHQESKWGSSKFPTQVLGHCNLDSTKTHQISNLNSKKLPTQYDEKNNLDSAKSNKKFTVSHVQTESTGSGNSVSTKLIEAPILGETKPETDKSTIDKCNVDRDKSNVLPPSSSPTNVIQSKKLDVYSNQATDRKLFDVLSLVLHSSQSCSSSVASEVVSSSSFSPRHINLPSSSDKKTPSTKIDKSSGVPQKPVIFPSSSATYVYRQKTTDTGAHENSEQNSFPISSQPSPYSSDLKLSPSFPKKPPSSPNTSSSCSSSLSGSPLSTSKEPSFSTKQNPTLAPSNSAKGHVKNKYIWVEKVASLTSMIPVTHSNKTNPDSNQTDKKLSHIVSPVLSSQPSSSHSYSISSSSSLNSPNLYSSTSSCSSSSIRTAPSTPESHSLSTKLTLSPANFTESLTNEYLVKDASHTYVIPEDIKDLIKNNIVPAVLMKPLSPTTYKDHFAALIYAEDFYHEKWDGFEMKNVTLELHPAAIYRQKEKYRNLYKDDTKDEKLYVAFVIDSIPEERPFLLSKDFVFLWPSGSEIEPFQGVLFGVRRSNLILADFKEDFHSQHSSSFEYNVKFAFNRVCLKRAHQAIAAASDALFRNFLFPDRIPKSCLTSPQLCISHSLSKEQISAIQQILSLRSPPPYIVEGPISVIKMYKERTKEAELVLTKTGVVIQEAVLQILRTNPFSRILICSPSNSTCDGLMRSLMEIPESDILRVNAAFRKWDEVPSDILLSSAYEEATECFSCPSLKELQRYKVISSTFMSSFRLQNAGLQPGYFSHIFLVDSSSVIEPETIVPLANLANENTVVVITGKPGDCSRWVRSNIARDCGLKVSYFERLRKRKLYGFFNSGLIINLEPSDTESWPSFMNNY